MAARPPKQNPINPILEESTPSIVLPNSTALISRFRKSCQGEAESREQIAGQVRADREGIYRWLGQAQA